MKKKLPSAKTVWRRIVRFNKEHSVIVGLRKFRSIQGEAYFYYDKMVLDPTANILTTYVHELIHLAYHNAAERDVASIEKKICKNLSMRQYCFLIRSLYYATSDKPNSRKVRVPMYYRDEINS